jgi:TRAP-type transport system small permease protein
MPASSDLATSWIGTAIARTLDVLAVISSVAVTGLMIFLVVARYMLGLPVIGLLELIMLAAVALYMTGALIASRKREHLTVDWLADRIQDPKRRALHDLLIAVLTLVVTAFFVVWAYRMFSWGFERPQVTPAYRIPLYVPQLAIGVAAVGCLCYAIRDLLEALRRVKTA